MITAAAILLTVAAKPSPGPYVVIGVRRDGPRAEEMQRACEGRPNAPPPCRYVAASAARDERGQLALIAETLAQHPAGMVVLPGNAMAVAALTRDRGQTSLATIDADLPPFGAEQRNLYLGPDNSKVGADMARHLQALLPAGGWICLQIDNPAGSDMQERVQGLRDTLAGVGTTATPAVHAGRLDGAHGWREPSCCPLISQGNPAIANRQIATLLTAHPDLSALVLLDGEAQLDRAAFARSTATARRRLQAGTLVIAAFGLRPPQIAAFRAGRSQIQAGPASEDLVGQALRDLAINVQPERTPIEACTMSDPGPCR